MYSYAYLQNIPEPMSTSQFVLEVRVICTFPSVSFSQADRRQTFEQESESRERGKKKTAFTKEASSGKQDRKRGRPKGTNVSTVGQSQQTLSAFFYGSV